MKTTGNKLAAVVAAALAATVPAGAGAGAAPAGPPNILFVILDDVGVDQMASFGFGGVSPPKTVNMDLIAAAGVKFTNVWGMPECSSSRAAYFTGRYPSHNGVGQAILGNHLPQSYVSPFETTLPRVLAKAGYKSAMVGKYHLGDELDPAGACAPASRGFDAFIGAMSAGPPSIDRTAGGVDPTGAQACGYFQTDAAGACYTKAADGTVGCTEIDAENALRGTSPSRSCLQSGGVFAPNLTCSDARPAGLTFDNENAYYVWTRTTVSGPKSPYFAAASCGRDRLDRRFMTGAQGNDGVSWWRAQSGPRMMTLSFNAMHTPFQKAGTGLVPDPADPDSACNSLAPERFLIDSVLEGADAALGRAMGAMGLAKLKRDGRTIDELTLGNTMVVIVGDNGSFGPTVRATDGFSVTRSKGTVYQTGVWVPLIVAGAKVAAPGRSVDAPVNITDLYRLFAEAAGVDADVAVPPSHRIDGKPMLAYLTDPGTRAIREMNFTEIDPGTYSPDPAQRSWPCAVGGACSDTLFTGESFCRDNGGTWYGPGAPKQYGSCCAVQLDNPDAGITLTPLKQMAARVGRYKMVRSTSFDCRTPLAGSGQEAALPWADYATKTADEFYDVARTKANPTGMDVAGRDMLAGCTAADPADCLPAAARTSYRRLSALIAKVSRTAEIDAACRAKGDGDMDMRIGPSDLAGWKAFDGKGPSRYDVNVDGETDADDLAIIKANLGTDCMSLCRRADLDRNGRLEARDGSLILAQSGRCDVVTCSGDLDGDRVVDATDRALFKKAQASCGGGVVAAVEED